MNLRKVIIVASSVVLMGVTCLQTKSVNASSGTKYVTATAQWQNLGNDVKDYTGNSVIARNTSNVGTLNKTRIRVMVKRGDSYAEYLSPRAIPKDDRTYYYALTKDVAKGEVIRFCYRLPLDTNEKSDLAKLFYNLN